MEYKEYIDGDFIIREYPNGTMVKTAVSVETEGQVIELPKNPVLALQEENVQLKAQLAQTQQEIADTNAMLLEFMEATMV